MRRIVTLLPLLSLLVLAAMAGGAAAQSRPDGEWVRLGVLRVEHHIEKDSLSMPDDAPAVTAVRLQAKGGRVVVGRIHVAWSDGTVHSEDRRINLLDGERTRPVESSGRPRQPRYVGVVYLGREWTPGQRLELEVWGMKAPPAPAPTVGAASGETVLARFEARRGLPEDRVNVPVEGGRPVTAIRLEPSGGDAEIASLVVHYDRGASHTLRLAARVAAGTASVWMPVDAERTIRRIEVVPSANRGRPAALPTLAVVGRLPVTTRSRSVAAKKEVIVGSPAPSAAETERERSGGEKAVRGPPPQPALRPQSAGSSAARAPAAPEVPKATAACIAETQCTPVPVFFGTSRARKDGVTEIAFTHDRSDTLVLGQATVTVPRAFRKKGEIPRPSWWDLTRLSNPWREDPTRHFTILAGATRIYATTDAFLDDVRRAIAASRNYRDHAFVFVHGFNVSFEDALYRTAQIAYDLGQEDEPFGTPFLFSWPSAGGLLGYAYDKDSSRLAVPHLRAFLELVATRTGARHVHLIAHSMGNAALLAAMEEVLRQDAVRPRIGQVILAAPDVDAKEFTSIAARILPMTRKLTLYASATDRAMVVSREIHVGAPRAGDLINGRPVAIKDLEAIDVSAVSTAVLALNHNVYADRKELLNDMRRLMLTDQRPPDERDINLRRVTDQSGTYWKYVP
jgi:esterase/lipase superfamily enzyme